MLRVFQLYAQQAFEAPHIHGHERTQASAKRKASGAFPTFLRPFVFVRGNTLPASGAPSQAIQRNPTKSDPIQVNPSKSNQPAGGERGGGKNGNGGKIKVNQG
jgi:hypothetical protein